MIETKKMPLHFEQSEICANCSAGYEQRAKPKNYLCFIASIEEYLHRTPTAEDMKKVFKRIGRGSVDNISSNCPNGYRSPQNLPLR